MQSRRKFFKNTGALVSLLIGASTKTVTPAAAPRP